MALFALYERLRPTVRMIQFKRRFSAAEKAHPRQPRHRRLDRLRGNFGQHNEVRLREIRPSGIDVGLQLLSKPDRIDEKEAITQTVQLDFHLAEVAALEFRTRLERRCRPETESSSFLNNGHGFSLYFALGALAFRVASELPIPHLEMRRLGPASHRRVKSSRQSTRIIWAASTPAGRASGATSRHCSRMRRRFPCLRIAPLCRNVDRTLPRRGERSIFPDRRY